MTQNTLPLLERGTTHEISKWKMPYYCRSGGRLGFWAGTALRITVACDVSMHVVQACAKARRTERQGSIIGNEPT